jgi:mono/diheme cytochrome c family protein
MDSLVPPRAPPLTLPPTTMLVGRRRNPSPQTFDAKRLWSCRLILIVAAIVFGTPPASSTARAAEPPAAAGDPLPAFFAQHCRECHAGPNPKGKFALTSLTQDFADKTNRERWLGVAEQIDSGTMPPGGKPRPTKQELAAVAAWIKSRVAAAEQAHSAVQGRVVLRRLNRSEYENTMRDLLGIRLNLKDLLPEDTSAGGFDNNAEALHVSSYLMENYLAAADKALDAAIANGPRPQTIKRRFDIKEEKTVKPTGSVYRHVDDGVAIFSSWVSANIQVTLWNFRSRERGDYRFRIAGYGYQTKKPVTFHVVAGTLTAVTEERLLDYYSVPPEKPTVIEFVEHLESRNCIRIVADALGALPPEVQKVGAENYKGPGLVVQWVEIEGPLVESWPPASHRALFGDLPLVRTSPRGETARFEVTSKEPLVDAERILRDFARRAFRREVTEAELRPFVERVRLTLARGDTFEQAMRVGLKAVLVSPHFLFLRERAGGATTTPTHPTVGALDDFALAARLSYFLWSSMPDDELLKLAEKKQLRTPGTLRAQVERMLRDPKSAAFTENFAGQWLGLRAIDATLPDRMLYPEYDDILKSAMVKEVNLVFNEVLRENLSLTNFVDSDFTFLNSRLAHHYRIPGVEGLEMRKVALQPGSRRGGVMTMAAVLKVTANGTTTSPILRGAWVLDRILGTPPPKPTVDVEAVDPDIRGATTIRQQLAKHRSNANCSSCHAKIDPPGFALENYDVIGGWRETYRKVGDYDAVVVDGRRVRFREGVPVDAADVLPDGRKFRDIDEYKQLLLTDKDQLARSLAEKLIAYSTGAAPTAADAPEIDAIVARGRDRQYGFRALIHEVVQSKTFQSK